MDGKILYLGDLLETKEAVIFSGLPDMMNVPKIAEVTGVSVATIRREIARGKLQCVHVGSRVLVTKKALLRYVGEE